MTAPDPTLDRRIAFGLLALWAVVALLRQWGNWAEDLSAVYVAGWLWDHGQGALIYDTPPGFFGGIAESWRPAMAAIGAGDRQGFAYVYPPLWAVLAAPLTRLGGPQAFMDGAAALQIPLLAASVWLAGRLFKPAAMPWWLWSAAGVAVLGLSIQSYVALYYNQPSITVGFLVLLAFDRLQAGWPVLAGATLALAAAIKLTPAAYVLVFLIDGRQRAALAFLLFATMLALLSLALTGWPAHAAFLASLRHLSGTGYLIAINISLVPALLAFGSAAGWMPPVDPAATHLVYTAPPAWPALAVACAAAAVLAGFARALCPLPSRQRCGIGLFAMSIILPLFGPLGWQHYYVVPMLLLPGLFGLLPAKPAAAMVLALALPSLTVIFAGIGALPWPTANYLWAMSALWLALLACLYVAARRAACKARPGAKRGLRPGPSGL